MIANILSVALGGALGSAARHLVGLGVVRLTGGTVFPYGIITVNIVGSFLMGLAVVYAGQRSALNISPLVMTGFLGGFTTFSAFSLETVTLFERGQPGLAGLYVVLTVALSVGGLVAGLVLARGLWA